jgi:hypothetical protein
LGQPKRPCESDALLFSLDLENEQGKSEIAALQAKMDSEMTALVEQQNK